MRRVLLPLLTGIAIAWTGPRPDDAAAAQLVSEAEPLHRLHSLLGGLRRSFATRLSINGWARRLGRGDGIWDADNAPVTDTPGKPFRSRHLARKPPDLRAFALFGAWK